MHTREQLEKAYDILFDQADIIVKKHNPCRISHGRCLGNLASCCSGCKYLGPTGCTTKALTCKMWFCVHSTADKKLSKELEQIKSLSNQLGFVGYRYGKKESIEAALRKQETFSTTKIS